MELLFLKSNNRDVSFSTVISLFRTRKKCVFGAILVFKFPYNPHCIKNFKKTFFFQVQKFECLWNYLFKFKKQTNTEILLWAIRVLTRIFGKIMLLKHLGKSVRLKTCPCIIKHIKCSRGTGGFLLMVSYLEKISMNTIFRIFSTC